MRAADGSRINNRKSLRRFYDSRQGRFELGKILSTKTDLARFVVSDMVEMLDLGGGVEPDTHRSSVRALAATSSELVKVIACVSM